MAAKYIRVGDTVISQDLKVLRVIKITNGIYKNHLTFSLSDGSTSQVHENEELAMVHDLTEEMWEGITPLGKS